MKRHTEGEELFALDPELGAVLRSLAVERRDPHRHAAGRAAVMAAAARARSDAPAGGRGLRWRRRFAIAALTFTGANLALGGVVALAAGAQPDSILYGVKRAAEAAKLSLTFDPVDKARLELDIADRRADEAAAMARNGRADLALQAARDATNLVREAGAALSANPSVDNEQALRHASAQARARLEEVFAALESGADPGAAEAARSLDDTWKNGLGAPGSEGTAPGEAGRGTGSGNAGGPQGAPGIGGGSQGSGSSLPAPVVTPSSHSGGHGHTGGH